MLTTLTLAALLSAPALGATPLPTGRGKVVSGPRTEEQEISEVDRAIAVDRFEHGRKRIRRSKHLVWGGLGAWAGDVALTLGGAFLAFDESLDVGVPVAMAGLATGAAGMGMVIAAPIEVSGGLREQRDALARVGMEADRGAARTARTLAIGGSAGILFPPLAPVGYAGGMGFSHEQARRNERVFQNLQVTPTFGKEQAGVKVSGRF